MSLHRELKDANVVGRLHADSLAEVLAMQLVRRYSYFKDLRTSRGGIVVRFSECTALLGQVKIN